MRGLLGRSELKADYLMQSVMKCNSTFREMMPAFRENSVLQPFMHSCFYSLLYLRFHEYLNDRVLYAPQPWF